MSNTSLTTKVTQSRGWTLALGIAAAALAAILLIAYLVQYRSSVNDSTAADARARREEPHPEGHLRAPSSPRSSSSRRRRSPKDDLKVGAISDPAYLNGRVAVGDIFPGQQITTADLSAGLTDALPTQLSGHAARRRDLRRRRAGARRLRRERRPRRHLLRGSWRLAATRSACSLPNVLVMRAPASGSPAILRLPDARRRRRLRWPPTAGTLWFLLRPAGDAKNPPKPAVTTQQLQALITSQPKPALNAGTGGK